MTPRKIKKKNAFYTNELIKLIAIEIDKSKISEIKIISVIKDLLLKDSSICKHPVVARYIELEYDHDPEFGPDVDVTLEEVLRVMLEYSNTPTETINGVLIKLLHPYSYMLPPEMIEPLVVKLNRVLKIESKAQIVFDEGGIPYFQLPIKEEIQRKYNLELVEKKGKGYIKLYKNRLRIFIGGINTRKYNLMKALIEPLDAINAYKKTDYLFEQIMIEKDNTNQLLSNPSTRRNEQIKIIRHTISELRKIKKLQGKIKFDFSPDKDMLRIFFV